MDKQRITYLLGQFKLGVISAAETAELNGYFSQDENKSIFLEVFAEEMESHYAEQRFLEMDYTAMIAKVLSVDKLNIDKPAVQNENEEPEYIETEKEKSVVRFMPRWVAAASVVIAVSFGAYLIINRKTQIEPPLVKTNVVRDVKAPEKNRATITLGNGQQVFLDSAKDGAIAQQGQLHILKMGDGKIAYAPDTDAGAGEVMYNTLSNPRGSKPIFLTLSDGSQVWLNAASSITYPTAFAGRTRKVSMSGEAYFEVAHDAKQPFIVSVPALTKGNNESGSMMDVEVLGTHFNINAYNDEEFARTTLLEGSVKITSQGLHKVIKPGEQTAVMFNGREIELKKDADLTQVMAWKNGQFDFRSSDITTIMKQAARWYDIEVIYKGLITEKFSANISRSTNVSNLFKMLAATKAVHFEIEGNKVTVSP